MERANDNSALSSMAPVEAGTASNGRPSSFSSELVTRTKLLTREEECTLKTALAFVVIRARAKARAEAEARPDNNESKRRRITESCAVANERTGRKHESIPRPSILDQLFCRDGNSFNNKLVLPGPRSSRSLECVGGKTHVDYMFRAAKTLAKTWLLAKRKQNLSSTANTAAMTTTTTKALMGAAGHLAHQLQLLLVAISDTNGVNHDEDISKPSSVTQSSMARSKNREERAPPRMRYRRPPLSSKVSVAGSISSTPSISSRTGSAATIVTPATNHSNSYKNNDSNGHESDHNDRTVETAFVVQEWIRSTLLQQNDQQNRDAAVSTEATQACETVLFCRNTTVLDVLASFHVYSVMIPQIARISPPLIGHVFQVVARLVKDLYSDKIAVVGDNAPFAMGGDDSEKTFRDIPVNGRKSTARLLLDHLATSALGLLELCWTTEIASGDSRTGENHRSFLLLSLQEFLGDLLVPLSRSELAGEHYRLTVSASRNRTVRERTHHQHQLVRQPPSQDRMSLSSVSGSHRQATQRQRFVLSQSEPKAFPQSQTSEKSRGDSVSHSNDISASATVDVGNERTATIQNQSARATPSPPKPNGFIGGCHLDPEAKLLLRMAVYRLILIEQRG